MTTTKNASLTSLIRDGYELVYESAYESACEFGCEAAGTTSATDDALALYDASADDAVTLVTAHDAPRAQSSKRFFASTLLRDTRGANLVEYIIVVGLVALIAIVGFKTFGQKVKDKIEGQSSSVGNIQQ